MTFKVPAPKENLISTPRTRSYLRKKTFMYMYVHAKKHYTGYNIYWSCIRRKKDIYSENQTEIQFGITHLMHKWILYYSSYIFDWKSSFLAKKTFAIKSSKTIIRTLTCLNKKSSTNMYVCVLVPFTVQVIESSISTWWLLFGSNEGHYIGLHVCPYLYSFTNFLLHRVHMLCCECSVIYFNQV